VVSLLLGILGSIIAWAICAEIDGWGPTFSRRLLWWAVRKLPEDQRSRYEEEWSAHLESMPTSLSRLVLCLGLCRAAVWRRIEVDGMKTVSVTAEALVLRSLDIALAGAAIIFQIPLLLLIAVLLYVADPGPIILLQKRVGKGGRRFYYYKFRTMRLDARERLRERLAASPEAAILWETERRVENDPRFSRIGAIIRHMALDELPALFNVVSGSMSFVGPRPLSERQCEIYDEYYRSYSATRPGISGL
jgi:exopolysaccharide production protein ExoY